MCSPAHSDPAPSDPTPSGPKPPDAHRSDTHGPDAAHDTPRAPDFSRDPEGILPAVAQDVDTGRVLMLAYMNAESFAETCRTGRAVYFSRSRQRLWRKGEESGHVQCVQQILIDCDADAILLRVTQVGAACHEGYASCFFREVTPACVYRQETRGEQDPGPDPKTNPASSREQGDPSGCPSKPD